MRYRFLFLIVVGLLGLAGCGGGTKGVTTPAKLSATAASPTDYTGGAVAINATLADAQRVGSVTATVTLPDKTSQALYMSGSGDNYTTTFAAPVNTGTALVAYTVLVTATDTSGATISTNPISFQVPAPPTLTTTASGLQYADTTVGTGNAAKVGDLVSVNYTGKLKDGTVFDSSLDPGRTPFQLTIGNGEVIKGWDEGLQGMKVGGTRYLIIPPALGYGNTVTGVIPANSTLYFQVTLVSIDQPS